jgi:AbrB family looped-hinge helix DNA binding protein
MAQYYESKITRKGQVTLPVKVRNRLFLRPGGKVRWVVDGDDVRVEPVGSVADRTYGIFKDDGPVLSIREEKEAYEQAVADSVMERYKRSLEEPSAPTRRKRPAKTPAR